jgi:hypothetical protein
MDSRIKYQESIKDGALRELVAVQLFIRHGFTVSIPNMSTRYDFIAEKDCKFIRVQVKPLVPKKTAKTPSSYDLWCIRPYSTISGKKRPYSIEDCDMVVGISLETPDYAIVPIHKIENRITEYRLSKHKNSMGKDYLNSCIALDN